MRADLTVDWSRREATIESDLHLAAAPVGPAGELYVGGLVVAGNQRGAYVRRLDAQGGVVWSRRLSTLPGDTVTALAVGPDGLLYAAGATFDRLAAESYGQQDM